MTFVSTQMGSASGILIAGPARCGKSTLAASLVETNDSHAVLTVDALFPAFYSSKALQSLDERIRFVSDYLRRPRFIDPNRTKVRSPADDIGDRIETVVEETVKKDASAPVSLIGAALDSWAENIGKSAWIAPDLHAEIYFKELIKLLPNLRMIVLLRDPREAVAASLYWRTYPKRVVGGWRMMLHKLLLWCLSADVGCRLSHAMPDRVGVVFADALQNTSQGMMREPLPGLVFPSRPVMNETTPYFSYMEGRGWLGPDGCWQLLLSDQERCMIEQVSSPWFSFQEASENSARGGRVSGWVIRSFLAIVLGIARFSPGKAKLLVEYALFPISHFRKMLLDLGRVVLGKPR